MEKERKMSKAKIARFGRIALVIAAVSVLVVAILVPGLAAAKDKPPQQVGSPDIGIDNGVINIDNFGEMWSGYNVWLYPPGYSNAFVEAPAFGYGANLPAYLWAGAVVTFYPAGGVPGVWYDAVVDLDLDGDQASDIVVKRSIMVPPGQKYFYARYGIANAKGTDLPNLRVFQGVDYDVGGGTGDEGGYNNQDFVWEHDLDNGVFTWVGFKGSQPSAHHAVDEETSMWNELAAGVLDDNNYYIGDTGVGIEWDLGTLGAREYKELTVKYAFADTSQELDRLLGQRPPTVPALSNWGVIGLTAFLGTALALVLWRRRLGRQS